MASGMGVLILLHGRLEAVITDGGDAIATFNEDAVVMFRKKSARCRALILRI